MGKINLAVNHRLVVQGTCWCIYIITRKRTESLCFTRYTPDNARGANKENKCFELNNSCLQWCFRLVLQRCFKVVLKICLNVLFAKVFQIGICKGVSSIYHHHIGHFFTFSCWKYFFQFDG